MSVPQWKKTNTAEEINKAQTGTYKSTASASLCVVALIISRASVSGPTVVPWRITWVTVALLWLLHPLSSNELFTSERWRTRGWRGWGGRGGRRAIPFLLTLPVSTNTKVECRCHKNALYSPPSQKQRPKRAFSSAPVDNAPWKFLKLYIKNTLIFKLAQCFCHPS